MSYDLQYYIMIFYFTSTVRSLTSTNDLINIKLHDFYQNVFNGLYKKNFNESPCYMGMCSLNYTCTCKELLFVKIQEGDNTLDLQY